MRGSRRGFAVITVVLVMIIVSVIGAGLYFRVERVKTTVIREQSIVAARMLADSGIEWVRDQGARGALKTADVLDMPSGKVGYLLDAETRDADNRRCRNAVVYGLAGRYKRVVFCRLVFDAPSVIGGPPNPGQVDAEIPTDVSGADLGVFPPPAGAAATLVAKAAAAARATPP